MIQLYDTIKLMVSYSGGVTTLLFYVVIFLSAFLFQNLDLVFISALPVTNKYY